MPLFVCISARSVIHISNNANANSRPVLLPSVVTSQPGVAAVAPTAAAETATTTLPIKPKLETKQTFFFGAAHGEATTSPKQVKGAPQCREDFLCEKSPHELQAAGRRKEQKEKHKQRVKQRVSENHQNPAPHMPTSDPPQVAIVSSASNETIDGTTQTASSPPKSSLQRAAEEGRDNGLLMEGQREVWESKEGDEMMEFGSGEQSSLVQCCRCISV